MLCHQALPEGDIFQNVFLNDDKCDIQPNGTTDNITISSASWCLLIPSSRILTCCFRHSNLIVSLVTGELSSCTNSVPTTGPYFISITVMYSAVS